MPKKVDFQTLDQRFEHFLDNVLVEFVESDFTPDKRRARRAAADADDLAFCKIYFPQIFNLPWNDLHLATADLGPGMYTRSGFRKCGKSAFVYTCYIIKPVVQDIGGLCGVNCETLEISIERTAALKRLIMRNKLLMYDYEIELVQDLKGHYIFKSTHLVGGSINKGLRAMVDDEFVRFRRIVNDDFYNRTNVTSLNHTARCVEFVEYECSGQLEDDGICITLGNATHELAPIKTLREKNPRNHFGLPALDENDNSTWPAYKKDKADWEKYWADLQIPWDVVQGDYLDKPAVRGDLLDPDWLKGVNVNTLKIVAAISACDPSHGQSPAACNKGLVTPAITDKDKIVILDIYCRKEGYEQFFDYVDALRQDIKVWKALFFEDDFAQWQIAKPYYEKWRDERNKTLPVLRHSAKDLATELYGTDKESRLMNLVYPHQVGDIVYDESIMSGSDWDKFKAQYLAFGRDPNKLDALDAEATGFIIIRRYRGGGKSTFKRLKERTFGRLEWFRA